MKVITFLIFGIAVLTTGCGCNCGDFEQKFNNLMGGLNKKEIEKILGMEPSREFTESEMQKLMGREPSTTIKEGEVEGAMTYSMYGCCGDTAVMHYMYLEKGGDLARRKGVSGHVMTYKLWRPKPKN
jgi:hypothetical protein